MDKAHSVAVTTIGHPSSALCPLPKRLLIIGLDGLNWQLLEPLITAGVVPNLARLRAQGAWGTLTSVIPTESASAWASFMTGQNPARHGVLGFMVRQPDGAYRHAKPAPTSTLWHLAGRGGLAVGVLNFPVTYPPDTVNGFLVSGMLTPRGRAFTYPPALGDEMLAVVPEYRLDLEWQLYKGQERALLRDLTEMTRQRIKAARYLQDRYHPDLMAVAFIGPDRLQHALWRHLDSGHPRYELDQAASLTGLLHGFYAVLDEAVGQLVAAVGDDAAVIVLSDHGFQSAMWQFRVDDWLASHGWLAWQTGRSRLGRLARRLDTPWVRHMRRRLVKDISKHFSSFAPGGLIDWSRTVAFNTWDEQQGIRLNVKGREREGLVAPGVESGRLLDEIRQALLDATEPETGQRVVERVWKREELYSGPHFEEMPDLVISLRPGFAACPLQPRLWSHTGWASGDHSLEGMLIVWGRGVQPGHVMGAELIDVAPTALYLLGQPVSTGMDGKVLTSALEATFVAAHPIRLEETAAPLPHQVPAEQTLTAEEETEIQERLRGLGYL